MEFFETKLADLFYYEVLWLSHSIVKKCEEIFSKCRIPDHGHMIQVDPDIHSKISSVLSDAANIKKLIQTQGVKLKGENAVRFKLRKERARVLDLALADLGLREIFNHKVRNTLEHFDEYLDETNYELSSKAELGTMAAYNLVISHWEVTNPRLYPIRLYVASEMKFYNMKWSVDIGQIHKEAVLIIDKLRAMPALTNQEPGGVMIRV
ncbi:hypothetical protein ABFV43_18365 [Pseudomonas fulva]|uniref:hypothetical protein n=1 Tax=Pseudomonas fulva TaxID=47880 RepID=UPI0034D3D983